MSFRKATVGGVLSGLALVALVAAFFNPPDSGVTSGEFEYVQRIDGHVLVLGTGEHVQLIGVNTPETVHPKKAMEAVGKESSAFTKRMVEGKLVRLEFDPLASGVAMGRTAMSARVCLPARRYALKRGDHQTRLRLRGHR
jgi:endonuclease YncB( thermonuclease family)